MMTLVESSPKAHFFFLKIYFRVLEHINRDKTWFCNKITFDRPVLSFGEEPALSGSGSPTHSMTFKWIWLAVPQLLPPWYLLYITQAKIAKYFPTMLSSYSTHQLLYHSPTFSHHTHIAIIMEIIFFPKTNLDQLSLSWNFWGAGLPGGCKIDCHKVVKFRIL